MPWFRCSVLSVVLLAGLRPAMADRSVTFEITLDGRVVLRANVVDEGGDNSEADADAEWSHLRTVCFRQVEPVQPEVAVPANERLTLSGSIELRARYGGSVRLRRLRLVPCGRGAKATWNVHPADYLATFRLRTSPGVEGAPPPPVAHTLLERPQVIAHRGASGYMPEHTREAAEMAWRMQADIIEQDVVLTRDGIPIVVHDVQLDTVTDVAQRFPQRTRSDGRWYAIDFDLDEVRTLEVNERVSWPSRERAFPGRNPPAGHYRIATLAEMIELIQGLNRATGRDVGIYPELKQPRWHREQGYDLSRSVLAVLDRYGYRSKRQHVYLQCFDADELRRLRREFRCRLALVQLIGNDEASDRMWTFQGLQDIATYAEGVGPNVSRVVWAGAAGEIEQSPLVPVAHGLGLVVHPYTIRRDDLPEGFADEVTLVNACRAAGVDGLFCDFPDRAMMALQREQAP